MKSFLDELTWRGLVYDKTPGLEHRLTQGPITGYVGFDPTSSSLQVGNLIAIMLLAHLQRAGGTPVILVGGTTGMIGDPSGKRAERQLLSLEAIEEHAESMRKQLERFLDFDGANAARTCNNADWLQPMSIVDFLRDVGKHFTLSYMLQKESVKTRMETGISYTEFSYMLLQGYDFLHLFRTQACELQMGGSDQWGNITAGTELIRRVMGTEAHALCAPLITTASGAKLGKTEEGTVWLDPEKTSPYKFFQFWINTDDRDIESYLKMFTFFEADEINRLMDESRKEPEHRIAQRALARDLTSRIHGEDTLKRTEAAVHVFFQAGSVDALRAASAEVWQTLANELPCWVTTTAACPTNAADLAAAANLTASKGEARRQLRQGGIYLNGERVSEDTAIGVDDRLAGQYLWLRRGKKHHVIVRVDA